LDGSKNGDETDVDCGGGTCATCADGKSCVLPDDCSSGKCLSNQCVAVSCDDDVTNGNETDVDCGGSCLPCADGLACGLPADCRSKVCTAQVCQVPACDDGVANGSETDVDCGGSCGVCAPGAACKDPADCDSGVCTGSVCQYAECNDNILNGDETDTDCGGSCAGCPDLGVCEVDQDCASGVCDAFQCQAATCLDGAANGEETDVDCGGPTCDECADGNACVVGGDCASGVCYGGVCAAPACGDGVLNGTETALDCGGSCAPATKCAQGQTCAVAGDCQSGVCNGTCQAHLDAGTLKVQYSAFNSSPTDNAIEPQLRIVNSGAPIALSRLKLRYWHYADRDPVTSPYVITCNAATVGCANVTPAAVPVVPERAGADYALEIGFEGGAGDLATGSTGTEVRIHWRNKDWGSYYDATHWSWSPSTTYIDWDRVTLYLDGALVWGVEPPPAAPAGIKIDYKANKRDEPSGSLEPHFRLKNLDAAGATLSEYKIRYYFTIDGAVDPLQAEGNYSWVQDGYTGHKDIGSWITRSVSQVLPAESATHYLEIGFLAGNKLLRNDVATIATTVRDQNWRQMTQANDYSYDATKIDFGAWTKIAFYRDGKLIYGSEPAPIPPRPADRPFKTTTGLVYEYYQHEVSSLPDFATLTPTATGVATTVNLSARQRDDRFLFRFTGYVSVPETGVYDFFTSSDDGSRLYIGNALVVDNDGEHGDQKRTGRIYLAQGLHAVTVTYFQHWGGYSLQAGYSGPGVSEQQFPASALFH
jgi:hypothetical protein